MRRFTAEYLDRTREGMWADRSALAPLRLGDRDSVLDVGCGTGELTAAIRAETDARLVGADRDADLLAHLPADIPGVRADAYRLPFPDDSFDLVVCQALLINLPDPRTRARRVRTRRERVGRRRRTRQQRRHRRVDRGERIPTGRRGARPLHRRRRDGRDAR
ncbi:MAG: class I SAM-dependent methyltransferase [Halobacteriales archaeon]|nr:class I SAM-dependent methyltransferase [Halobacteriales archaeon]